MGILHFNFHGLDVKAEQSDDPELLLNQLLAKDSNNIDVLDERIPYWAEIWPSSIGLSEFISENRQLVSGKTVLEIGCGPGLPGIVAALLGGQVEMTDYMQEALDLAAHNWSLNLIDAPKVSLLDWREPLVKSAEVIIASDVAYESRSYKPLIAALKSLVMPGGIILLSQPNRKFSVSFFNSLEKEGFKISRSNKEVIKDSIEYSISIYVLSA